MADLVACTHGRTAYELWQVNVEKLRLIADTIAAWKAARLDVLLCPGYGIPATLHGFSKETTPAASYTFLWNTTNFPAGTVPVTTVRADEEE